MSNKKSLKDIHTKVLLIWLKKSRAFNSGYSPDDGHTYHTTEELKEELATREHVPNKAEAKEIRRERANAKRNR